MKFLSSLIVLLTFTACSTTTNQGQRQIASVSQCPDESAAFEQLLRRYNDCRNGFGSQSCYQFCADAAVLSDGAGNGGPSRPTDGRGCDPALDTDREQCRGCSKWAIYDRDLQLSQSSRIDVRVGVDGGRHGPERSAIRAALSSRQAYELEDRNNSRATCLRNFTARPAGRANCSEARAETTTIRSRVHKDRCNGGGANSGPCYTECVQNLRTISLANAERACASNLNIASCAIAPDWDDVSPIPARNENGYVVCSVPATQLPSTRYVCSVPVVAVNEPEDRGWMRHGGGGRNDRRRDWDEDREWEERRW